MQTRFITHVIIITILLCVCGCKKEVTWQERYIQMMLNNQLADRTGAKADYFCLYDFEQDEIPELLLYSQGRMCNEMIEDTIQNEFDKFTILKYEKNKVEIVYSDECSYIDTYYDRETRELVLSYPNSQGSAVCKYQFIDGELKETFNAYSQEKYVVTIYGKNGESETFFWEEDYADTFEIVSDTCNEFTYFELTEENLKTVIDSYGK